VWLPDGVKSLRICVRVSTEYRYVTDGQTSCYGKSALCIASRGKNVGVAPSREYEGGHSSATLSTVAASATVEGRGGEKKRDLEEQEERGWGFR